MATTTTTTDTYPLPIKVISILGPPGSGKGTQCQFLAMRYRDVEHVSVGDVLRAEMERPEGSEWAEVLRRNMLEGMVGTKEMTTGILGKYIRERVAATGGGGGTTVFLLDGFPRSVDRAEYFEREVARIELVVRLDCPEDVLLGRLLGRARFDDEPEIIEKRIRTYNEATSEVIEKYGNEGKLKVVDGNKTSEEVSRQLEGIFDEVALLQKKWWVMGEMVV